MNSLENKSEILPIFSELMKGHVYRRILVKAFGLRAVSNEEKNDYLKWDWFILLPLLLSQLFY
jgi:hypothetical protein